MPTTERCWIYFSIIFCSVSVVFKWKFEIKWHNCMIDWFNNINSVLLGFLLYTKLVGEENEEEEEEANCIIFTKIQFHFVWNAEVVLIYDDMFVLMPEVMIGRQNKNFNSILFSFTVSMQYLDFCGIVLFCVYVLMNLAMHRIIN